ncbi:MAG: metallophosphoesterase, partial [Bacteroidales bacterium]|nr:metallophosphoesterase [Bacteroidales bacterium]
MKKSCYFFLVLLFGLFLSNELFAQFTGTELLGKPTDNSITVNIVPGSNLEYYYEYGTVSGIYEDATPNASAVANQPDEIVISGLTPNTRYFYRIQYSTNGGSSYTAGTEHSFWTQRATGSSFVFTIISDSHAMYNTQYQNAIINASNDLPDFHFDLGDTYMTDGLTTQTAVNSAYLAQRDPLYMDGIGHSAPIFLASGNHENEEGWNFNDSPNQALMSILARKLYFPTPVPDGFYSGNEDLLSLIDVPTYGDQYREDYYAWTWGDALFIVLDPFQYTMTIPYSPTAGETNDEGSPSNDRWDWSLGLEQFNWFKQTVENSNAKYKFVFAHHMVGGTQTYVRGGAVPAHMFEWGGNNADGTTWGFDAERSGWGDDPIHQIMIDNGVSAFFHGHDHQYAYEVRDGIVYQSLPRPSTGLDFNYYSESNQYTEKVLASPGHLSVSVTPDETTVEYITSANTSRTVQHSYTILPNAVSENFNLNMAVSGSGTTDPAVGSHSFAENAEVEITATADPGYTFVNWTGDVANPTIATTTVTLDEDKTVTANFVETSASSPVTYVGEIGSITANAAGTTLNIPVGAS